MIARGATTRVTIDGRDYAEPWCGTATSNGGSRCQYDYVMERQAIQHFRGHHNSIYHFVYGEKSFKRMARYAGENGNRIVCTAHHPVSHHEWMFRNGAGCPDS